MNGAKNVDIHKAVEKDARSNLNAGSESSQLEIREIGEKTLERETCRGEGTLVNITSITIFNKQPNVFQSGAVRTEIKSSLTVLKVP